jgi:hypothetical protein
MTKLALPGLCGLALLFSVYGAQAYQESPWCARFGGGSDYYENCNMPDFATCLREIRGTGGNTVCSPNPRSQAEYPNPLQVHRRANRKP